MEYGLQLYSVRDFTQKDLAYTLKKVATSASGSWIKVEFVGTIEINTNNTKTFAAGNPGELYVKVRAIERGDITDPTYSGGSSSGGGRG